MPVPSLLPQPASLIPLPENTLPPETFDDHCRTLEVMAEALELPDPNAPNSEAKLLDAAYFFDGPVFAKRLTRADVRTARVVMPAAIEPILPWLARDLLAPEIQFHVTTGSDATAEADEGSVHLLCMHCTSAVVPGTKQHLVVLFGMRSVIEALRLVEGDVIGVRKCVTPSFPAPHPLPVNVSVNVSVNASVISGTAASLGVLDNDLSLWRVACYVVCALCFL